MSRELNVPACQESLGLIIDKIINGDYKDVIDICNIIYEMRKYMPDSVKYSMSKPTQEMIDEIIKSIKGVGDYLFKKVISDKFIHKKTAVQSHSRNLL